MRTARQAISPIDAREQNLPVSQGRVKPRARNTIKSVTGTHSETEYEDRLLRLGPQIVRLKVTERLKIAEYLHDEFGPALVVAKIKLGLLSEKLPKQLIGCVNEISDILNDLVRRTRGSIQDLASNQVCQTGLQTSIALLIDDLQIRYGIICSVKLHPLLDKFPDEAKYVLYRAVRELLVNVAKHARASRVNINVSRKEASVRIELKDNGCGFAGHKASRTGGFGLLSVRADLATIGAGLRIFSRIGRGTRAIIAIPLRGL